MVISRTSLTTALLLGLALAGASSFAQAPTGSLTNLIVGGTNSLWDMSVFEGLQNPTVSLGMKSKQATNYWNCLLGQANPATPVPGTNLELHVSFSGPYVQDGQGRLSGKGTNSLTLSYCSSIYTGNWFEPWYTTNVLDLTNLLGNYAVSGSIKGVIGGGAVMQYRSRASATVPLSGKNHRLSALSAFYVVVDGVNKGLRESVGATISLSGQATLVGGGPNFDTMPSASGDGTWTLVLNFDPTAATAPTRLSGQATVTLNSGAVYPFRFTGRYSAKTGQSALLLKGLNNEAGNGKGATLSVLLTNGQITGLQGRVAGQIIKQRYGSSRRCGACGNRPPARRTSRPGA
jgi:hypothetical protein